MSNIAVGKKTTLIQPCPNSCGEKVHLSKLEKHRERCPFETVTCEDCNEVQGPRNQINMHKNESCFAKATCPRCGAEYLRT